MSDWRKAFERLSPPGEEPAISTRRDTDKRDNSDKSPAERQPEPLDKQTDPPFVASVPFVTPALSRKERTSADPAGPSTPGPDNNQSASAISPPKPHQRFRQGALPGDPPAPVVAPEATRTLVILELAGAAPRLTPDGRLELTRPSHVSPELRATAQLHQGDIAALLRYRATLEERWPAEPLPPPP